MKSTFNIFGNKYRIKHIDISKSGTDGLCCHENKVIVIDKSLKGDEYSATLLHELGHAMFYSISLHQTSISPDLEEIIVENFSKMITNHFEIKLKRRSQSKS